MGHTSSPNATKSVTNPSEHYVVTSTQEDLLKGAERAIMKGNKHR